MYYLAMMLNPLAHPSDLDPEAISEVLTTVWLGRVIHYLPEIDSTNELLQKMASAGAPTGTLVITDYQRQGRGRLQRRWLAPPGSSLLLSLLFRPAWPPRQVQWLTMMAGLAVVEAIRATSQLKVGLKWPNDVMLRHEGKWRKACGLLLATSFREERLAYAIMGIGLNVNIRQSEMPATSNPATSLLIAGGQSMPRVPLLAALLQQLETYYEEAERGTSPQSAWNKELVTLGRSVRVSGMGNVVDGIVEGTGQWGELLVRDSAGKLHKIAAGDVTLRDTRSDRD